MNLMSFSLNFSDGFQNPIKSRLPVPMCQCPMLACSQGNKEHQASTRVSLFQPDRSTVVRFHSFLFLQVTGQPGVGWCICSLSFPVYRKPRNLKVLFFRAIERMVSRLLHGRVTRHQTVWFAFSHHGQWIARSVMLSLLSELQAPANHKYIYMQAGRQRQKRDL